MIATLLDHQREVIGNVAISAVTTFGEIATLDTSSELAEDLVSVVSRLVTTDTASVLLDWWCKVSLAKTANGHCYQLPDEIQGRLRTAMEALRDLNADRPALEWLDASRAHQSRVEALNHAGSSPVDLDWHGNSKLPSERDAWGELLGMFDPYISELKEGRPGPEIDYDESDFAKVLGTTTIELNSRRWKEMERRAQTLVDHLYDMREDALLVVSAGQVDLVPTLPSIPQVAVDALGAELAHRLLLPLTPLPSDTRSASQIVDGLNTALADAEDRERALMAMRLDPWLANVIDTSPRGKALAIGAIAVQLDQLHRIETAVSELDEAGVDTDDIVLEKLMGDFPAALGRVSRLRKDEESTLITTQLRQEVEATQARLVRSGLDADPDLMDLIWQIPDLVSQSRTDEVNTRIKSAVDRLERHLADERLAELDHIVAALNVLGARPELLFDVAQARSGRPPSQSTIEELRTTLDQLRRRRLDERDELRDRLDVALTEADPMPEAVLADVRARRAAIRSTGDDDAGLMDALESLRGLDAELRRHRTRRWLPDRSTEQELVEHIVAYCTERIDYQELDLRRLYVAMKTKPFVILAGLTGSGKSSIVRLVAESIGATASTGRFRRVAVRPDWIDQSEVLGYINPVSRRFEPGWLADVIRACQKQPDQLFFVLLDEMNLAPVEQYLAELLSAMEEARAGFGDVEIPLYTSGSQPENADEWPPSLIYPRNLIVVGTVNVDETTRPLSDRVIDRANVLQLTVAWSRRHHELRGARLITPMSVDVAAWASLVETEPIDRCHDLLVTLAETLAGAGVGVGLRAHIELERFLANAEGVLEDAEALDMAVLQRIVPKIRGFKRDLAPALEAVRQTLTEHDCPGSTAVLDTWLAATSSDDTFIDGTAPHAGAGRPFA